MNIKRIIVDELPENCYNCEFGNTEKYPCSIVHRKGCAETRPSWCPLEPEQDQVCEWKRIIRHFPETFSIHVTKCHYEFDDIEEMVDWKFCPNCGKRIKYVESEE